MDIQKTTSEILSAGLTQQQLADLVPCSQATINAYVRGGRGKHPTLAIGMRLLEIHAQQISKKPKTK